ncbi:MAG: GlsB/YeaQ/YmgE family stress response membrane protein [Actinobacteria bacterium]|nr:MAG: GlsB/YeaQ/YmgE family stress response membrane protein [Actinomycetota bacterium]
MLALLIGLIIGGFLLGALARLAVPGPDPMPFWLTVAIGIGGSIIGGLVAYVVLGRTGGFLFGYAGAVLLVILYRRFVQGRGITGPEARAQPTRGWGLRREPPK